MHRVFPPLCFLLALAMAIAGFAMIAVPPPEANLELHQAWASGDDAHREVLEAALKRRVWKRRVLIGSLFAGAALMTVMAFLTMAPSDVKK